MVHHQRGAPRTGRDDRHGQDRPRRANPPPTVTNHAGIRPRPAWEFDLISAEKTLTSQYKVRDLAGFGCADKHAGVAAAGSLLAYVKSTQLTELPHIQPLRLLDKDDAVIIDAASRRNLELDTTISGATDNTPVSYTHLTLPTIYSV